MHSLVLNQAIALGVIQCFDNTAASGTSIATVTQPVAVLGSQQSLLYDVNFSIGLTCITSGATQNRVNLHRSRNGLSDKL